MSRERKPLSREVVERVAKKERSAGIDPDDEAARWLAEHDPAPPPRAPKSAKKSKTLHQWRNRQPPKD